MEKEEIRKPSICFRKSLQKVNTKLTLLTTFELIWLSKLLEDNFRPFANKLKVIVRRLVSTHFDFYIQTPDLALFLHLMVSVLTRAEIYICSHESVPVRSVSYIWRLSSAYICFVLSQIFCHQYTSINTDTHAQKSTGMHSEHCLTLLCRQQHGVVVHVRVSPQLAVWMCMHVLMLLIFCCSFNTIQPHWGPCQACIVVCETHTHTKHQTPRDWSVVALV